MPSQRRYCLRRLDDDDVHDVRSLDEGRHHFDSGERIEVPKGGEDFYFAPAPEQVMSKLHGTRSLDFVGH